MAKNIFTRHRDEAPASREPDRGAAAVFGPEARILCGMLLDASASMYQSGALEVVTRALPEFRASLLKHEETTRRLSWAVATYAASPTVVYPYGPLATWEPPARIGGGGGTAMGTAILEMLRLEKEHLAALASKGISYQHSFCFHVTDGEPNSEPPERLDEAARLIREMEQNHFSFYSIAVEGADIDTLKRLTPHRTPLKLAEVKDFSNFFRWLSASMEKMSRSRPGMAVGLASPMKADGENPLGWAVVPG